MRKISGGWDAGKRDRQFECFVTLLGDCKNKEQVVAVLKTLITASESAAIAQRLAIIRLVEKEEKYSDIALALGVSHNTILAAINLYHKNGEHNATFNKLLADFVFEPKQQKVVPVGYDPMKKITTGGFRQMMRDERSGK